MKKSSAKHSDAARLICLGFSTITLLTGCGTMKVTELKTDSAESYADHARKNGVAIGVRPFTDKKEIKETFKIDLLAKGLLPILLVAENQSESSSFILAKDRVSVLSEATGVTNISGRTEVKSDTAGNALTVAGAALGATPLLLVGLKMASDATIIQHNLADKEFYSRTLGPRQKAQGFIYFQFPKESPPSGAHHVLIELKDSATGELTPFDFSVNLNPK